MNGHGTTHSAPASTFRTDIEGLRALAVLAVLGYHADVPGFSGGFIGVDVFFVISGFLITGILFSEIARSGTVNLAIFFARRARRLLPASALVLVVTAIAGRFVLAPVDFSLVAGDIAAAALYVVNLRFAWQSTDYLAGDRDGSPVLHYWSLSVEEQFYLVWPLVLLAVLVWLPRGFGRARSLPALRVLLVATCLVSFAAALWLTERAQPWSFFSTWTRAWEFGAGALVFACRDAFLRLPDRAATALGWFGLAALALGVVHTEEAGFPGVSAWLPVLGSAAMIAAGTHAGPYPRRHLGWLLSLLPLRLVGRLSYSLYLWHWPVVVFAIHAFGPMHWGQKLAWTLASVIPAALAWRYVEKPIHEGRAGVKKRPITGLWIGLGASGSGVIAAFWLATSMGTQAPGAPSEAGAPPPLQAQIAAVRDALPVVYRDGCHLSISATTSGDCRYGTPGGTVRVALLGDSKAAQWFPALETIADERGWQFQSLTKSGCPVADVSLWSRNLSRIYRECEQWRESIFERLAREQPDLVLVASVYPGVVYDSTRGENADAEGSRTLWKQGWVNSLGRLHKAGLRVVLIKDTPTAPQDMASCVSAHLAAPSDCDFPPPVARLAALERDAAEETGVPVIDLTTHYCRDGRCEAVIDGLLVYRDKTHLTPDFVRRLSEPLGAGLDAVLEHP